VTAFTSFQRDSTTGQIKFDSNGYPLVNAVAGSNTYGAMQARIADEVLGSPTTAHIQNAIQDAISKYESERFYFNDMRYYGVTGSGATMQTVAGREYYADPDLPAIIRWPHIEQVVVLAFNSRYTLEPRTPQAMADLSVSTTSHGLPTDWCWEAGALRLYPIPDASYPLIITGTMRFAPLANSSDTNPWMNEAEKLIRCCAKRLLFIHITRDAPMAQAMQAEEQDALQDLRKENTERAGGPGLIRPSKGYF
jgi:hypothetical protein